MAISGPLARADLPGLFQRTCDALEADGIELLRCEVADVTADAVTVEALARLALAARRRGCPVELRGVSAELDELIAFMGLADVLQNGR